jgi:hypothetical protein
MLPMLPFIQNNQLVLACHITGVHDVNRNNTLPNDDYSLVATWAASISKLGMYGIIFHNNFSEATCEKFTSKHIQFIRIVHNTQFNPNVYRYYIYHQFITQYEASIKSIFVTDITDVVVRNNPFTQLIFLKNPDSLFSGDEPTSLANDWMEAHSTHLRQQIADYASYEAAFKDFMLLNCGIIGGNIHVMQPFVQQLWAIHQQYNANNNTAYTGDMGAFNYLARTTFREEVIHGPPINTVFKTYDIGDTSCWFRHK